MDAQRQNERSNANSRQLFSSPASHTVSRGLRKMVQEARTIDEQELQQDIARLQLGLQEVSPKMHERQFAIQLRQMQAQREQARMHGIRTPRPAPRQPVGPSTDEKRRGILDVM